MDYSNAKIYKILNTIDDDVYIGATCQPLSKRMAKHRKNMNDACKKHSRLYEKMRLVGVENFYIELVKETPCENAEQLRAIEGEHIRQFGTLNKKIEGRTQLEYRHDTKDSKAEYDKVYRQENKDKIQTLQAEYYLTYKDKLNETRREKYNDIKHVKLICEVCGVELLPKNHKKHLTSKNHLKAMEQL